MKKIILASQSPRRKELMELMGFEFEQIPSGADEDIKESTPEVLVQNLSLTKACDIAAKIKTGKVEPSLKSDEGYFVIGADTIVVLGNEVLGKPKNKEDAFRMLKELSGNTHRVLTGVTIIDTESEKIVTFHERTDVTFYKVDDKVILDYIETGDPFDKAGAYGIQSLGYNLVEKINGDFNNVVGLPVSRLYWELKKF